MSKPQAIKQDEIKSAYDTLKEVKAELERLYEKTTPKTPKEITIEGSAMNLTENRGERIARKKLEEAEAKKAAKEAIGKPVLKKKASMSGDDIYIEHTPEKEPFVLINLPEVWRNIKHFFKSPIEFTKKHWVSLTSFVLVCVIATIIAFMVTGHQDAEMASTAPKTHDTASTNLHKEVAVAKPVLPVVIDKNNKIVDKPAHKPVVTPPVSKHDTYIVKDGDTLWTIAIAVYHDPNKWISLYNDNRETLIQHDARNASDYGHWLHAGDVLVIHTE